MYVATSAVSDAVSPYFNSNPTVAASAWYSLNPSCFGTNQASSPEILSTLNFPTSLITSFIALSSTRFIEVKVDSANFNTTSLQLRDTNSGIIWSLDYGFQQPLWVLQRQIAQDPGGNIFWGVQGNIFKLTADGRVLWQYNDPAGGAYYIVVAAPDGGVLATNEQGVVTRLDASGNFLWRINVDPYNLGLVFAKDGLGGFYVTSYWGSLARYDDSGNLMWKKTLSLYAFGAEVDDAGNIYLGLYGTPPNSTNFGQYVLKTDSFGNLVWALEVTANPSILTWRDGFIYAATSTPCSNCASPLYKISATGLQRWVTQIPTYGYYGSILGYSLDPSGDLFVSGNFNSGTSPGAVYQISNP
jgi:hypothetical protein